MAWVFGLGHGVKGSNVWQNYTHLSPYCLPIHVRLHT